MAQGLLEEEEGEEEGKRPGLACSPGQARRGVSRVTGAQEARLKLSNGGGEK